MPHLAYIIYVFAMGACVGSFLNVVVWRLPRGKSLISPPSHCPKCQTKLSWRDNIPVFGWIFLKGKCRYCSKPISARYPIIEFICGALFMGYYVAFYMLHIGPYVLEFQKGIAGMSGRHVPVFSTTIVEGWPTYVMSMWLIASLLAASLIDAELFIIPLQIPWICAVVGLAGHALFDRANLPGNLIQHPGSLQGLIGLGGGVGLVVGMILFVFGVIPQSFPKGEPAPEVDAIVAEKMKDQPKEEMDQGDQEPPPSMTPIQIRMEILKELLFILPVIVGFAALVVCKRTMPGFSAWVDQAMGNEWVSGLAGASFGAMVGAGLVWGARILGTMWFGRIAMGLGDVHLMFGIGAIVGASQATLVFFGAPFMAIVVGLWGFITRKQHELPYGPYLSMAAAVMLLIHQPIESYLSPGFIGIMDRLSNILLG